MKLLITGTSGFLGRRAATYFAALGCQVLAPTHTELDITEKANVDTWFRQHSPQAVLHCAAVSDTGLCQREPDRTALVNVTGSCNLAAACAETGAKLIFCSSDQVYAGSSLPGPHLESEPLTPGNVYGTQKLLAEQQCRTLCPDLVSLRLSWMYSTQFLSGEHGHLLTSLLTALQEEHTPLSWTIHDRRGITDVDSVVQNLPKALDLPAGVYNFGAENDQDTYSMLRTVFETLGLKSALQRLIPNPQSFHRDIRMDGTLAASYGILFESTQDGLCRALSKFI